MGRGSAKDGPSTGSSPRWADEPIRALTTALRAETRSGSSGDVVLAPGPRVEEVVARFLDWDRERRGVGRLLPAAASAGPGLGQSQLRVAGRVQEEQAHCFPHGLECWRTCWQGGSIASSRRALPPGARRLTPRAAAHDEPPAVCARGKTRAPGRASRSASRPFPTFGSGSGGVPAHLCNHVPAAPVVRKLACDRASAICREIAGDAAALIDPTGTHRC